MTRSLLQYEVIPFFFATISGLLLFMNIPAEMTLYFGPWGSWCGGAWCPAYWETMINIDQIIAVNCVTFLSWILLIYATKFRFSRMQPSSSKMLLWIRLIYMIPLVIALILLIPFFSVIANYFYSDYHIVIFSLGAYLTLAYFAFILSANIIVWIPRCWFR